MKLSVTDYEAKLTLLMQRYLRSEISFDKLGDWVDRNELPWGGFEQDSLADKLAFSVMHAVWESENGDHTEDSLREAIADSYAEIFGVKAS